jgi:hypothetical protein
MTDIAGFIDKVKSAIVNPLMALIFAASAVVFVWGAVKYILGSDNEEARSTGSQHMLWGIIGMFIIIAVGGIIAIIKNTIGA